MDNVVVVAVLAIAAGLVIDVSITCPRWTESLPAAAGLCQSAAEAAFRLAFEDGAGPSPAEVSVVLSDDDFIRGLNRDYRDRDAPTNVLSFPASDPKNALLERPAGQSRLLGDIVVAFETTAAEAAGQGKALGDHLCHLVVHGMLHLLGHDHQTPALAEAMEKLETDVLAGLDIADPYGEGSVEDDPNRRPNRCPNR